MSDKENDRQQEGEFRPCTESCRERDALRHLHPWISNYNQTFAHFAKGESISEPKACEDTAITAFAQLVAWRLQTRRVMITIVSSTTEYVLTEATKSMSLQSDAIGDARDERWLGACEFARGSGINDLAVNVWRKTRHLRHRPADNEHYYMSGVSDHYMIVSDLREHTEAAERAFAKHAKSLRFYFSVPIRDMKGSVIGCLSLMDDKPRYGVSASDMLFCEDMSDTIAQHLHNSIIRSQRYRSERLIQALSNFNSGRSSLRDWWLEQDSSSTRRGGRYENEPFDSSEQRGRLDDEFGIQEPSLNQTAVASHPINAPAQPRTAKAAGQPTERTTDEGTLEGFDTDDFNINPVTSLGLSRDVKRDGTHVPTDSGSLQEESGAVAETTNSKRSRNKDFDLAKSTRDAYARASNLIRESLGASGVVFLHASGDVNAKFRRQSKQSRSPSSSSSSDSKVSTASDNEASNSPHWPLESTTVAAFSTRTKSTLAGAQPLAFGLSNSDVARLIKAYPGGKVFSYEENGSAYSSSGDSSRSSGSGTGSDAHRLPYRTKHNRHAQLFRRVMGEARSIAFFPIIDANGERWKSCVFIWSTERLFEPAEDMTYLSAFAHSLRAELGRLETIASDHAKGSFITSVSHELNSPIHGILAGVELLQDSQLTAFQKEMARGIASAGQTLSSTVTHILDYSKISNLTDAHKRARAIANNSRQHFEGDSTTEDKNFTRTDIAQLTEEIVESAVSAYRNESLLEQSHRGPQQQKYMEQRLVGVDGMENISVVLDIDKLRSWVTPLPPGLWTRIVMNILGNALKFTKAGTIIVKLSTKVAKRQGNHSERLVDFSIEDTGIGMSELFVRHDLFTPFSQANSHTAGTGLGLSITKELAKEIDATIDVKSNIGKGTKVSIVFRASFNEEETAGSPDSAPDIFTRWGSKRFQMLDLGRDFNSADSPGPRAVFDSIGHVASEWLESDVIVEGLRPTGSCADVCVIWSSDLLLLHGKHPEQLKSWLFKLASKNTKMLVIGHSATITRDSLPLRDLSVEPLFINQPVGPRSLLRAIDDAGLTIRTRRPNLVSPRQKASRLGVSVRGSSRDAEEINDLSISQTRLARQSKTPEDTVDQLGNDDTLGRSSAQQASALSKSSDEKNSKSGSVVLLVEDNHINMKVLAALMKKQKLKYECAVNGLEALTMYKAAHTSVDVIIMDMSMPVMDGFESTTKIREFEQKRKLPKTVIAALTGVTNAEARARAMDAGIDQYLAKPIKMKHVAELIAEVRGTS